MIGEKPRQCIKLIILLAVFFISEENSVAETLSAIPKIISAPVILYDEGGNILEDGDYRVILRLKDSAGEVVYVEEQEIPVYDGVAGIALGNGYQPGMSDDFPSEGLDVELFLNNPDLSFEVRVEGQSIIQESALLASQPYAFIAEKAITVEDSAVTSRSIADGEIQENDLAQEILDKLNQSIALEGSYSTLSQDVGSLEERLNIVESSSAVIDETDIPQYLRPYSYGKMVIDAVSITCTGYNTSANHHDGVHSGACDFAPSQNNTSYFVMATASATSTICGSKPFLIKVSEKSANYFKISTMCADGSTPGSGVAVIDFVVFLNAE